MKRTLLAILVLAVAAGCSRETLKQNTATVKAKVTSAANDITAPFDGKPDDPNVREQERFDQRWRDLQSFRAAQQQAQQQAATQTAAPVEKAAAPLAPAPAGFKFVTGVKQSFKGLNAKGINDAPVLTPLSGDMRGPSVLRAQVYLDRLGFSVGSIDGRWGRNSAITVWWFQRARGIEPTGDLDRLTYVRLASEAQYAPVVVPRALTEDDLKGPFEPVAEDVYEKAKQDCLCYESLREKLAERFHSSEDFLQSLNPDVKFADLQAGSTIEVPNVRQPAAADNPDIARVIISISGNSFNGFDANNNLVFHAPTTVGAGYDPSPSETLQVTGIASMPQFHYDPTLYHEVPDSDADAQLPPGPNSPVGVVWMSLSKPHYGIHGTSNPDSIGYASSHGCIRLTNWDATDVEHHVARGVQVSFVDTRQKGMPDVAKK